MFIKKIEVQNFRQIKNVCLELQKNTTILAGPNNSGKTSFILLLIRMFQEKSFNFLKDDFNVYDKHIWSEKIYKILKEIYDNKDSKIDDELIDELSNKIFPIDTESTPDIILPELTVKLQIDYNEQDDISNFANYIMDLDKSRNSFYFIYKIILNKNLFLKDIKDNWNKIYSRLDNKENDKKQSIIEILLNTYCKNLVNKCYFTDEEYYSLSEMQDFKSLFNFDYIGASRPLDDSLEKDKHELSKALLLLASKDSTWKTKISKLPDDVLKILDDSKVKSNVEELSTVALNSTIDSISQTNGGHTGKIQLDLEVSEEHIEKLIQNATNAKYSITDEIHKCNYCLNETSQGLGYSNLIYMHTRIENYIKSKDPLKVNFLVIEEPESHMHPQMQYVFANALLKQYDKEELQGLITTHSTEIVRGSSIERLRVIREETLFNSHIYDLSSFIKCIKIPENCGDEDATIIRSYKSFYEEIGIAQLIFADFAIFFEGDTERLYFKKIINLSKFEKLQQKYIAYIQVGNAYAYYFKDLLEYLKIKSLIITDIDYEIKAENEASILSSITTNSTIKKFYEDNNFNNTDKPKPQTFTLSIKSLYEWIKNNKHIVSTTDIISLDEKKANQELIYLAFQTENDNYARTLEAAMLSKVFGMSGYELIKRSKWLAIRKETGLKFSIPNNRQIARTNEIENDSDFSLIDILKSTSDSKTDFMYSVIINGYAEKMLPDYIKEGLEWLMK